MDVIASWPVVFLGSIGLLMIGSIPALRLPPDRPLRVVA
jgi:hypothetical protein